MFLLFRRGGGWAGGASAWPASAFAVLAFLLIRDFLTSRRRDRLPDIPAALAWGAAGLLELSSLSPVVADSRIVPAVLFPSIAFLLPAIPAATYSAAAFAWLLFAPDGSWPPEGRIASIVLLGVLGLAAGRAVRRKLRDRGSGRDRVQEAIDESRSLMFPWEGSEAAADREMAAEVERWGPLRSREDLMDAIRRILEGILPITGADRIHYVFPSPAQGGALRAGASAYRGMNPGSTEVAIPDDYVPVREATLFRRTFFSDGQEAGSWAIGGEDGGIPPSGVAAAPVATDGNVEGAILALRTAEGRWTEPVGQALEMAAYLAARELAAARRQFQTHRYLAMQEGFHRLIRRIAEISENVDGDGQGNVSPRGEVYRAAVEQVRRHLDAGRVLLIEAETGGKRGRIAWESGGKGAADREEKVPLKGTYVEWVLGQGVHRIFSADSAAAGRFPLLPDAWTGECGGGCLLVPVPAAADGFHGVMVCEAGEGRNFDGRDADTVKDMLAIMRMGISHALRLENLEKEAKNDGLTGLLNRKTFCAQLTNLLSRLDGRYPCAVVMLDIDHFKKVNDTYGHPAGDEVIRKVSSVIRKTVRKVDMAGRYGGEEFVIYLHSADAHHASRIAERLRLMIRQTSFVFDKREVGVTASLGFACYPGDGKSPEELLRNADVALYRSKQGGRDRTTAYLKQYRDA
jgi:diguanylate cyclase (GGDEF)-like protein